MSCLLQLDVNLTVNVLLRNNVTTVNALIHAYWATRVPVTQNAMAATIAPHADAHLVTREVRMTTANA